MTKQLELTQGKVATVDNDVHEWASKFKYRARKSGNTFYARRDVGVWPFQKTIYLHREIMQAPPGVQVDHIDGNGLNCTRANLRLATHAQNQRNTGLQANNTSGYKGVYWHKRDGKWHARIKVDGKNIHLGLFDDPAEAAKSYDTAAREYHGKFANTNF